MLLLSSFCLYFLVVLSVGLSLFCILVQEKETFLLSVLDSWLFSVLRRHGIDDGFTVGIVVKAAAHWSDASGLLVLKPLRNLFCLFYVYLRYSFG